MPLPNTSPDMSPDADDREIRRLDVLADFPEVTLHGFPRALGGDAHALSVVVTDGAARRERVAKPVAVVGGKCRWAMSEKVAVPLSAATTRYGSSPSQRITSHRRLYTIVDDVVGDVEQTAQEGLCRPSTPTLAHAGSVRGGSFFGKKPPFAPTGTMMAFLTCCAFTRSSTSGAEIVATIGPAQAAARDGAEAQVHAFYIRRGHPDFAIRLRRRQVFEITARNLERHVRLERAVGVLLVEVGAQDVGDEPARCAAARGRRRD